MHFDHVGVATPASQPLSTLLGDLLDAPVAHRESFEGLDVTFLDLGNGYLELLEPLVDEGAIARWLDREGPGIHHIAFETADLRNALDVARDLGVERVDEEPRPGAWGHDVAFLHPDATGGVLVELVEHR